MTITKSTKLKEVMDAYPWLLDEAVKMDSKFKALNNPIGKAIIKKETIGDLSNRSGLSIEEIIGWINEMVEKRS